MSAAQSWEAQQRRRLVWDRLSLVPEIRDMYARQIAEKLNHLLGDVSDLVIAGYWPIRGEPDLLPWLASIRRRKGVAALPFLDDRGGTVGFKVWHPGAIVQPDAWEIPAPSGCSQVHPDIVVVPLIGFDATGSRLGYGHCAYDRTFSGYAGKPFLIGVGYEIGRLTQPLRKPCQTVMDAIVTEAAVSFTGRRMAHH